MVSTLDSTTLESSQSNLQQPPPISFYYNTVVTCPYTLPCQNAGRFSLPIQISRSTPPVGPRSPRKSRHTTSLSLILFRDWHRPQATRQTCHRADGQRAAPAAVPTICKGDRNRAEDSWRPSVAWICDEKQGKQSSAKNSWIYFKMNISFNCILHRYVEIQQ